MKKQILNILFLGLLPLYTSSQNDSVKVSLGSFLNAIIENHPVVKQAQLLNRQAKNQLMLAKGSFDPEIKADFREKSIDGKNYYTGTCAALAVPTWFGPELKVGYDELTGAQVNPESKTQLNGLSFAGISIPIAEGLIMNERRAILKQSKLMLQYNEAEKIKSINKILFQACKDYWEWFFDYHKYLLHKQGFDLAMDRFDFTRRRVLFGDAPPIDSVEALMQAQNFDVLMHQSLVEYKNAGLILSTYLWDQNGAPRTLSDSAKPSEVYNRSFNLTQDSINKWTGDMVFLHPELQKIDVKNKQLQVERKLHANKLLPKLNVEYYWLSGKNGISDYEPSMYNQNYKLNATFAVPIFLRSERAKLNLTKIKILDNQYEYRNQKLVIQNSIRASYNDCDNLFRQIKIQESLVKNSAIMREGEKKNFENGESSMFLINTRENTLIGNTIKYYEFVSKLNKAIAELYFNTGRMKPLIN